MQSTKVAREVHRLLWEILQELQLILRLLLMQLSLQQHVLYYLWYGNWIQYLSYEKILVQLVYVGWHYLDEYYLDEHCLEKNYMDSKAQKRRQVLIIVVYYMFLFASWCILDKLEKWEDTLYTSIRILLEYKKNIPITGCLVQIRACDICHFQFNILTLSIFSLILFDLRDFVGYYIEKYPRGPSYLFVHSLIV